jgi:transcriptional regulator with XRE-family HTH domain
VTVTAQSDRAAEFTRAIRAELKHRITSQNLTLKTLAQATGHHPATLGRWLNGKLPLRLNALGEICAAIGADPADVVQDACARMTDAGGQPVE